MASNKAELLLEQFERNIELEKFFLSGRDQVSLVAVLREQEDLIPELLRQMKSFPAGGPHWKRLQLAADARLLQETLVADLLGEISRELGRLRQSSKRLQDWKKAWHHPEGQGEQFTRTYA